MSVSKYELAEAKKVWQDRTIQIQEGLPGLVTPIDFWQGTGRCARCGQQSNLLGYTHATGGICGECVQKYMRPGMKVRAGTMQTTDNGGKLEIQGRDTILNVVDFEGLTAPNKYRSDYARVAMLTALCYLNSLPVKHALCQYWQAPYDARWSVLLHYSMPGKPGHDGTDGWGTSIYLLLDSKTNAGHEQAKVYAVGIQHGLKNHLAPTSVFQPWVVEVEGTSQQVSQGLGACSPYHISITQPSNYMLRKLGSALIKLREDQAKAKLGY